MIYFKLKELAEEKGYSIKRLAREAKVDYVTLHRLKTGKQQGITFPVLERISIALGYEPKDFFEYRPDSTKDSESEEPE